MSKLKILRGNKADLPLLAEGEPALTLDEKRLYVGDGASNIAFPNQSDMDFKANKLEVYTKDEVDAHLSNKADLNSPELTGIPTTPTAAIGDNSKQIATTSFVKREAAPSGFGLGTNGVAVEDYNTFGANSNGLYRNARDNTPNSFLIDAGETFINMNWDVNAGSQVAVAPGNNGMIGFRSKINGRYKPWRTVWHNTFSNVPASDNVFDLGSASYRMRNIFAGTATISTSDARQKKDIIPLDTDMMIAFLLALNPVQYKFIDGTSDRPHYGLIAQEVERAMHDCNIGDFAGLIKSPVLDEDGNDTGDVVYGLRYGEFTAILLKIVQNHEDRISSIEERLDGLRRTNK